MSPSKVTPEHTDHTDHTEPVDVDELVSISMHELVVVVRPKRKPDALGTQVLADVVNAATTAASTVVLHRRDSHVESHAGIERQAGTVDEPETPIPVRAAGVGILDLRADGAIWTIDFGSASLVRSDRPVDRLFIGESAWTPFDAVWIGPQYISALTADGSLLAGRRAHQPPIRQAISRHGQDRSLLRHSA